MSRSALKNLRGLIAAAVVLAVLGGLLYWSNRHKSSQTVQASSETQPSILKLSEEDIVKVDLRKKGEKEIDLARDASGNWRIETPEPLGTDRETVSSLVSSLASLNGERVIETNARDLGPYGLTRPALEVEIRKKSGGPSTLLIGDETPTGAGAYAALQGDPRVFTIASYTKGNIDKSLNDLRDKRLLTVVPDKISRLELVTPKQDIEFGRSKDQWQIVKPKPLRADGSKVDELVRKLTDAKMDSSAAADATKAKAAFGSGSRIATAKLTDESSTQQIEIRKQKQDYYASSSVVPGVFKIGSDLGQAVEKKLDDFRNTKIFDFGFNDPSSVEMRDAGKSSTLIRAGDQWSWNGKKVDPSSAESFVAKLRDLSSTKFLDTSAGPTAIQLKVISDDGKRTEQVLLCRQGSGWVAKRESDASLYQLDSKGVEDLQKAAADLSSQPAAKPSSK